VSFVRSRNGSLEDAEDVFQEGIRLLILNVRAGKYKGEGSLAAYLFGVCKRLWYKRFQKMMRDASLENTAFPEAESRQKNPEELLLQAEQVQAIEALLASLGTSCRRVLEMWQLSFSMREIARELGYKNEAVARKKKRLCMVKLLEKLDEEPELLNFLKQQLELYT